MGLAAGGKKKKKKKKKKRSQCSKSQSQQRINFSSTNGIQFQEYNNITAPYSSWPARLSTISGAQYDDVFPAKALQGRRKCVCLITDILVGMLHSHSLAFMSTDLSVTHSNSVSRSAKVLDRLRSNSCLLVVLFIHRITGVCKIEILFANNESLLAKLCLQCSHHWWWSRGGPRRHCHNFIIN